MAKNKINKKEAVARAMGKVLTNRDWTVFEVHRKCTTCEKRNVFNGKYCTWCAKPLKEDSNQAPIDDLYAAFQAGLKRYNV